MKDKDKCFKRNLLWNAGGNVVYLIAQWLITVLVTVLGGLEDAGILSLAMSISASFQTLALFGIRSFQVSDREGKFSDTAYVGFRAVSCSAALLFCLIFALCNGYSPEVCHAISLFMIFRLAENYSDVLHGIAQNNERLDIAGKSFAVKGVGLLVCFLCGYWISSSLLLGILLMAAFSTLSTLIYDLPAVRHLSDFRLIAPLREYKLLVKTALPLCIYQFLNALLLSLPKWFLEIQCGNEVLGAYSSIFAPVMLLQAAGIYLYTPFTTVFSRLYGEGYKRKIFGLFYKISAAILGFFLLTLVAAVFFGEWALVLVFGDQILPYVDFLMPILIANLAVTYLGFLTMLTVVLRQIKWIVAAFATGTAVLLLTPLAVNLFGANGASYALLLASCVINAMLLCRILILFSKMTESATGDAE